MTFFLRTIAFIAALKNKLTPAVIGVIVTTTGFAIGGTSLLASLLISTIA